MFTKYSYCLSPFGTYVYLLALGSYYFEIYFNGAMEEQQCTGQYWTRVLKAENSIFALFFLFFFLMKVSIIRVS